MSKIFIPRSIIKIEGKGFNDLTLDDVALMIEADSSISPSGNDFFDSSALDTFLHNAKIKREELERVREEILRHIYIDVPGSDAKMIDTEFLRRYANQLRRVRRPE